MAHFTGPCLTLAGPGSGKTHTLTCRIRHLIDRHQVPPEKILVITFTRAAAMEMRQRFVSLMGEDLPVVFGTFHSVFFRMLQEEYGLESDALATGKMRLQLLREAASRCHVKSDRQDFFQVISREFSYIKNTGIDPAEYHSREFPGIPMGRFFDAYEEQKEVYGLLDFDDMLTKTLSMFRENPRILERWRGRFSFYLLDEVQDMNRLQFQIIRLLAHPHNNLFAVGDDDQSIYAFRGADPGLMLEFPKYYPDCRKILLEENYRCSPQILSAANNLIAHNGKRYAKKLHSAAEAGEAVSFCRYPTAQQEGEGLVRAIKDRLAAGEKPGDMAVLFRGRRQMLAFVPLFAREGIPFYLRDHVQNPLEHWAVRDVEAYLLLAETCRGRMDRSLLLQVMNRPARYLARASLETEQVSFGGWKDFYRGKDWICERIDLLQRQLQRLAVMPGFSALHYIRRTIGYDRFLEEYGREHPSDDSFHEALELVEDLARGTANIRELLKKIRAQRQGLEHAQSASRSEKGVGIYTMHGAKGLEFATVFVPGCCEGECPSKNAGTTEEIEEERRIFYVAVTRARRRLYLSWSARDDRGQKYPSRFLKEMQEGPDERGRGGAGNTDQSISSKAASSRSSSNRSSTRAYSSSSRMFSREGAPVSSSS